MLELRIVEEVEYIAIAAAVLVAAAAVVVVALVSVVVVAAVAGTAVVVAGGAVAVVDELAAGDRWRFAVVAVGFLKSNHSTH